MSKHLKLFLLVVMLLLQGCATSLPAGSNETVIASPSPKLSQTLPPIGSFSQSVQNDMQIWENELTK
jgi:outer membrane biogenesis lipoprotein LolB